MINLDSILKSRDITLPTKVCLVKAMVFPVVMYGCESWTVKKAERQRIDIMPAGPEELTLQALSPEQRDYRGFIWGLSPEARRGSQGASRAAPGTQGFPRAAAPVGVFPQFKSINSSVLSFLYSPTLTSMHDYWKNHSFD